MKYKYIIEKLVEKYGKENQDIVCIEELSELQKELTKSLRGKENKQHLEEEIADCIITISSVIVAHDLDEVSIDAHWKRKLERVGIDYEKKI